MTNTHPGSFKCDKCDFSTYKKSLFDNHYGRHIYKIQEDGKYHCDQCEFTTMSKESIRSHRKRHRTYGKYKCDICEKVLSCQSVVEKHKREKHFGEMAFSCDKCDYKAPTKQRIRVHQKLVKFAINI